MNILQDKNRCSVRSLFRNPGYFAIILIVLLLSLTVAQANNISISNVTITGRNMDAGPDNEANYTLVQFDISWENSWRTSAAPNNWDAAWLFIKFRVGSADWEHAWLNETGHTAPSGSTIDIGLLDPGSSFDASTNPGMGAFIYRDANGTGSFTKTAVKLRWNYGANGLSDSDIIDYDVYAIEMVYVPQATFNLGDNEDNTNGSFYMQPASDPYPAYSVISESAINVGTTNGYLYYEDPIGGRVIGDQTGPIPAAFPKGYAAFYCMKHEITQGAYVNFLNTLDRTQQNTRTLGVISGTDPKNKFGGGSGCRYIMSATTTIQARNGIRCDAVLPASGAITVYNDLDGDGTYNESNDGQDIACNWLSHNDVGAFLDWAGLRPMTELEYEKACRGTVTSGPMREYCWGSTNRVATDYTLSNSGESGEVIATNYDASGTNANASYDETSGTIAGPSRVGIHATTSDYRIAAGATYYGILDMSGNVTETCITVGNATGRAYTGVHGNGLLDATGDSDATSWPGTDAIGYCERGGSWWQTQSFMRISDRYFGAVEDNDTDEYYGGRGVRTAP